MDQRDIYGCKGITCAANEPFEPAEQEVCGFHVGELGDGTPVYCILESGHDGDHAPLPAGL